MIFQNPTDINDYYDSVDDGSNDSYYDSWIPYDGVLASLQIKKVQGTSDTDANGDPRDNYTMTLERFNADLFADIWCTANQSNGQYDSSECVTDDTVGTKSAGVSTDFTEANAPSDDDYCEEKWTIVIYTGTLDNLAVENHERCVRVKFEAERLFQTTDNSGNAEETAHDIDWEYRTYAVSTGWRIIATTGDPPAIQDFSQISVDFDKFRETQELYTAAVSSLTFAASTIAAIVTLSF